MAVFRHMANWEHFLPLAQKVIRQTKERVVLGKEDAEKVLSWFEPHTQVIRKALVTGSGGLIGSECVRMLGELDWEVVGLDNNMRQFFFGEAGSTLANTEILKQSFPRFRHYNVNIRDRQTVRDIFKNERPDFIVHTAAQPSHDEAASIPYEDFDVNAVGTMNLLVASRDFCRDSPLGFTSTNKVYGDRPNRLPMVEEEKRYDYADSLEGIDESLSIDASLHSLFGPPRLPPTSCVKSLADTSKCRLGFFGADA